MSRTLYTVEGLQKLAKIARDARGQMSYRDFAAKTKISNATLGRIENLEIKEPEISTLIKLSVFTPYNLEELIAICHSKEEPATVREYKTVEDVLPMVNELPVREKLRLIQIVAERIADNINDHPY